MAITIVETPGDASANSFLTEAEFIAYQAARLNVPAGATVTGSTCTEAEKAAMIEATRELNDLKYIGDRPSVEQALSWPRAWAPNPDAPTMLLDPNFFVPVGLAVVIYFATNIIPQRVKDATAELALQFLKAGTTDLAAIDPTLGIVLKRIDVIETEYANSDNRPQGLARFPRVINRLEPLLAASGKGMTLVRT